jgi:hypothetical protein
MDDDDVSKWEPDAISAPSKRIQNNNILNPEDQDNNKNSNVSKKKVMITISVPIKIQRLWLAELSRLDDSHTVRSALEALQRLSSSDKMPSERIPSFIALFATNHDHKVHRPFTRRACVQVFTNLCTDRRSVLERYVGRIATSICGYCGDDDPGVRRACAVAFEALVTEVISGLTTASQFQALEAAIIPIKELLKTSHNPRVQDGSAMCLAHVLDACEGMAGSEKMAAKLIPPLLKRLRRTKPMAKASVLNAISASVCRSSDLFARYAVDIVTALLNDIRNATESTGGWQGKKCAVDILTQVGEAVPLPLHLIEDIRDALENLRFDKVPAVRDCVKDSLAVYDNASSIAAKKERDKKTKIRKEGDSHTSSKNEDSTKEDVEEYMPKHKNDNRVDRQVMKQERDQNKSSTLVEKRMVGERKIKLGRGNHTGDILLEGKIEENHAKNTKSNDYEKTNAIKQFSLQNRQLRRDFDYFREETRNHLTSLQRQVNSMESMLRKLTSTIAENEIRPNVKIQKTIFRRYNNIDNIPGMKIRAGRTEEVFEEALSNYEENEFVRFAGKFGVKSLSKLSLATQKKTLLYMLEAMEGKKFIPQYIPWFEQAVNLNIHNKVFVGPGVYERVVTLLTKLHEKKLLKSF